MSSYCFIKSFSPRFDFLIVITGCPYSSGIRKGKMRGGGGGITVTRTLGQVPASGVCTGNFRLRRTTINKR